MDQSKSASPRKAGQPMDQSKSASTRKAGQPMDQSNFASPRKAGQPMDQSKSASTRKAGQPMDQSKSASPRKAGQPMDQSNSASPRKAGQPMDRSKSASPRKAGQPMDQSKSASPRKVGQPIDQSKSASPRTAGQPVDRSKSASPRKAGQPMDQSKSASPRKVGQPLDHCKCEPPSPKKIKEEIDSIEETNISPSEKHCVSSNVAQQFDINQGDTDSCFLLEKKHQHHEEFSSSLEKETSGVGLSSEEGVHTGRHTVYSLSNHLVVNTANCNTENCKEQTENDNKGNSPKKQKKRGKDRVSENIDSGDVQGSRTSYESLFDHTDLYSPRKKRKKENYTESEIQKNSSIHQTCQSLAKISDEVDTSPRQKNLHDMLDEIPNDRTVLSSRSTGEEQFGDSNTFPMKAIGKQSEIPELKDMLSSETSLVCLADNLHTPAEKKKKKKKKKKKEQENKTLVSESASCSGTLVETLSDEFLTSPNKKEKDKASGIAETGDVHCFRPVSRLANGEFTEQNQQEGGGTEKQKKKKKKKKRKESGPETTDQSCLEDIQTLYDGSNSTVNTPEDSDKLNCSKSKINSSFEELKDEKSTNNKHKQKKKSSECQMTKVEVRENGCSDGNQSILGLENASDSVPVCLNDRNRLDGTDKEKKTQRQESKSAEHVKHDPFSPPEGKNDNAVLCYVCKKSMKSKRYIKHLANKHNKKSYQCNKCQRPLSSKSVMKLHLKTCCPLKDAEIKIAPFHCKLCPLVFSIKNTLTRHERVEHGQGAPAHYECSHCGKVFSRPARAKQHQVKCVEGLLKKPPGVKDFDCEECGKAYASRSSLNCHIRTIHRKTVFKCVCGRQFRGSTYYYAHKKVCRDVNT